MNLNGKVALITGSSRGIGSSLAVRFAECGAKVAINYRENRDAAQDVDRQCRDLGAETTVIAADVRDVQSVKSMFDQIKEALGPVEVLVNNAGMIRHSPLPFMSDDDWNDVLNVNLKGAFNCTREAARDMMKARWGRIVNISSDAGRLGELMGAHYSSAKAGLLGFSKATAREFARYGITVNAVTPGFVETDMTIDTNESVREKQIGMVPLGRYGKPDEIADLVAFLASERAAYITGQTISIDGGLFMGG